MKIMPASEMQDLVGEELGVSDWVRIDQERIDMFAEATMDHQFIHVDPEAAKATPWGTTVAHGFLTLSLITPLMSESLIVPEGMVWAINYGTDKVRFLLPVKVGSRIRARTRLGDVTDKGGGRWLLKSEVTVEIEGEERPALVAEALTMFFTA